MVRFFSWISHMIFGFEPKDISPTKVKATPSYSDPGLLDPYTLLILLARLWQCGMLRFCRETRGFVSMFTVVKELAIENE